MASWGDRVRATAESGVGTGDLVGAFEGADIVGGIMMAVLAMAVLLILVPILLFGIELVIIGVALAIGLVGRFVFRQPWAVQALPVSGHAEMRSWKIVGWRNSGAFVDQIASELQQGRGFSREPAAAAHLD